MMHLLDGYLIMSPDGFSLNTWMSNIRMMFVMTSGGSLALILIWNLLFSRPILGRRGIEVGANLLNAAFLFIHFLGSVASLYNLLRVEPTWIAAFLLGSKECMIALLLPITLIVAFFLASRFMAPEVISYRFRILKKFRSKLWIRYY